MDLRFSLATKLQNFIKLIGFRENNSFEGLSTLYLYNIMNVSLLSIHLKKFL